VSGGQLFVNLSTIVDDWRGDEIRYRLKRKNYDELILAEVFTPRILVLVTLPRDIREWLSFSPDQLIMRQCSYWLSLSGLPESDMNILSPCPYYLTNVRMGQIERGSFMLTMLSPVPPALTPPQGTPTSSEAPEPYERQVVRTLIDALDALGGAAREAAARGGMEPFTGQ
jgi:hypothetical protein